MRKTVNVFGANIPVFTEGGGRIPLLIVGPADIFRKNKMLPDSLSELFTIYFVDCFSDLITLDKGTISKLSMDDFVKAIDSIRSQLGLKKVALFAHSALGVLAYEYTLKHAESTLCLLMVAAAPIWTKYKDKMSINFFSLNSTKERKCLYEKDQKQLKQFSASNPKDAFINNYIARRALFFCDPNCTTVKNMWSNISHCMPLVSHYFKLINNYDVRKRPSPEVPIFLAMGLYDASMPFYLWTDDVKETIKQTDYYIFEKSAHYPMLEEPELFFDELKSFIDNSELTKTYSNSIN